MCNVSLPGRARTCDPLIKSQLLYQLSYGELQRGAKVVTFCKFEKPEIYFTFAHHAGVIRQVQKEYDNEQP
jgi:hypothetical protein